LSGLEQRGWEKNIIAEQTKDVNFENVGHVGRITDFIINYWLVLIIIIIQIIIIIIIMYLTANWLSPGGSGYYACT
jgi:hypothetical protein